MKNEAQKKRLPAQNIFYKFALLLVSVACIVYFLPREKQSSYQFEVGRPWPYGQLMAEFDFPIYKSDEVIAKEKDSIMQFYFPYYHENDTLLRHQTTRLKNKFLQLSPETKFENTLLSVLKDIYAHGIMATEHYSALQKDSIEFISVYKDKAANKRPVTEVYSTKSAYELLMNTDSLNLDRNLLQQLDLLDVLIPNLTYDKDRSEALIDELQSSISYTTDMVFSGTKIVDRGEIVTPTTYRILESWLKESQQRESEIGQDKMALLIGQIIFVSIILLCFIIYLTLFRNDYFEKIHTTALLFSIMIIFPVLTSLMVRANLFSVYIIPYAMAPMIIRVFLDSRTASMAMLTLTVLCSIGLRFPYEFILIQVVSGWASILSLRELSQRSQLMRAAAIVTLVNVVFYFGFEMIHENDLTKLNVSMYKYFCVNGVLLLFTYPLLYMLEKLFSFTSDVTLIELSNINSPLMQRLSEVAPGTFQHSMQVANLAAEVAKKIEAKSQLVRTGALYHDIGKLQDPVFFTENQTGVNPHSALTETHSAEIIINHVTYGLKLAEKYNLPTIIKDFIRTHHGKGMASYFYISYKNNHPDEEIDESKFRYPGPNPTTKEQAILMMADSVEAASRSLPEYTEESIGKLVDKIIDGQMNNGNFLLCPITFRDIALAKQVFKEKLKTIYHTRIQYPDLKVTADPHHNKQ